MRRPVTSYLMVFFYLTTLATGQTCTYQHTASTKGLSGDWRGFQTVMDITACEDFCTASANCVAAEFNSNSNACYLYQFQTTLSSDSDTTFLDQVCSDCTMSDTLSVAGIGGDVVLSLETFQDCNLACNLLSTCEAVTFSGGTCTMYGGIAMTANPAESVDFVKQTCLNTGKRCCMEPTSTLKATGAALYTLTSSLASCKEVCRITTPCAAVTFRDNLCFMHLNIAPSTFPFIGSTYSVKTCTGSPPSSGEITLTCVSSSAGRLQAVFLPAVFSVMITAVWLGDTQLWGRT